MAAKLGGLTRAHCLKISRIPLIYMQCHRYLALDSPCSQTSMEGSLDKHEAFGGIEDTCASSATTQPSSSHSTILSSRDEAGPATKTPTKSVADRLREVEALQSIGPGGLASPAAKGVRNPAADAVLPANLAGLQIR